MVTLVLTPQSPWNKDVTPLIYLRDRYQVEFQLRKIGMLSEEKTVFLETNLMEVDLSDWVEMINGCGFAAYLYTKAENLIKMASISVPVCVIMVQGTLNDASGITLRFINPTCWYVLMTSTIDEFTDINDGMFHLESMNATRLFVLVDTPVPFELRMYKVYRPGTGCQIVYRQIDFFQNEQTVIHAGN